MATMTKDRIWEIGAEGEDVADLQRVLGINETGSYDQATANAVAQYQKDNNLTVDGVVGDETLGSILGSGADSPAHTTRLATSEANASPDVADEKARASFDMAAVNLPGISDATRQALSDLIDNGYTPSASVDSALRELNDVIENEPGAFSSKWSGQIDQIMDRILNREDFTYDVSTDPTYQIYKDVYQRQGQMAMMDTMGQAAALTGGYGSSYATTAGNQAYQNSLTNLNSIVPELQAQARTAYDNEGQRQTDAYTLMSNERTQEENQWQQQYAAWQANRDDAQGAYDNARQYDYDQYGNKLTSLQNLAQLENTQYNTDAQAERQYAYETAIKILNRGGIPSNALLAAAGISKADAKKLRK